MNTKFRSSYFKHFEPISYLLMEQTVGCKVRYTPCLLLFVLNLVPCALRPPHTNQPLTYLQPLLGPGIRLKEHITDSMDIFSGSLWPRQNNNNKKMVVIHLSSVCNLVDGSDLSLASFASLWRQSNKKKCLFSQFVMQECIYSFLMLSGSHNSHYFLNRVSNPFVLCRTNQSINKYLENKCNMLGITTKEEVGDWEKIRGEAKAE